MSASAVALVSWALLRAPATGPFASKQLGLAEPSITHTQSLDASRASGRQSSRNGQPSGGASDLTPPDSTRRVGAKPSLPFPPGQPLPNPALHFTGDSPEQLRIALARAPLLSELGGDLSTEEMKRIVELTKPEREAYQEAQVRFVRSIAPAVTGRTDWEDENGFPTQEAADEYVKKRFNRSRICYVVAQDGVNGRIYRTLSIDPERNPEVYWMLFERQQFSELLSTRIHGVLVSGEFRK